MRARLVFSVKGVFDFLLESCESYDPFVFFAFIAVFLGVCAVLYRTGIQFNNSLKSFARGLVLSCALVEILVFVLPIIRDDMPAYLFGMLTWIAVACLLVLATEKRRLVKSIIRCLLLGKRPWINFLVSPRVLGRYRRLENLVRTCGKTEIFLNKMKMFVCSVKGFLLFALLVFICEAYVKSGVTSLLEWFTPVASSDIGQNVFAMLSAFERHSVLVFPILGAFIWLYVHRRYHFASKKVVREREESCLSFVSHAYPVFQHLRIYLLENIERCVANGGQSYERDVSSDCIQADWIGARLDNEIQCLDSLHKDFLQQAEGVRVEVLRSIFNRCGGLLDNDRCYLFFLPGEGLSTFISVDGVNGILCRQKIEAAVDLAKSSKDFSGSLNELRDSMILETALACIDVERFIQGFAPLPYPNSGLRSLCQGFLREKE